eukprot:gene16871-35017_t
MKFLLKPTKGDNDKQLLANNRKQKNGVQFTSPMLRSIGEYVREKEAAYKTRQQEVVIQLDMLLSSTTVAKIWSRDVLFARHESIVSDTIGRRAMFTVFTLGSVPVYLALPYLITSVVETGTAAPLYMFVGCTAAALSFMGGKKRRSHSWSHVVVHVVCCAGGIDSSADAEIPLRETRYWKTSRNGSYILMLIIDPMKFQETFGAPVEKAYEL